MQNDEIIRTEENVFLIYWFVLVKLIYIII